MTKSQNRDNLVHELDTLDELRDATLVRMATQQELSLKSLTKMSKPNHSEKENEY